MIAYIVRVFVSAIMIATVSEVARRSPRLGAVLLTLPIISILAFGATWFRDHDLKALSQMAKETLVLVPLGLPFFVPLAFADRLGLGFWPAILIGLVLATLLIVVWLAITAG